MQDSGDTGHLGTGERHEQKIYYRDRAYYQLYKQNQVQFPLKNIYNHDPIYGVSDGSTAKTDVFREYLFANAVRGNAFWELYYSPSILDEAKWKVTADALDWAESRFDVLQNAKLFGNQPKEGVYGYSSWRNDKGILSITNPLDKEVCYPLTLNEDIGIGKSVQKAEGIQVYPYQVGKMQQTISYGDTLQITLQPHETKIMEFNLQDTVLLEVDSITMKNGALRVKFTKRVNPNAQFQVDGQTVKTVLLDDYRTYARLRQMAANGRRKKLPFKPPTSQMPMHTRFLYQL